MSILTKEVIQKILNDDWLLMDDCEGLENCTVIKKLARMTLAAIDSEPNRNPVLAYADSYRDMAKQGVESVPIWSVITDLERNIAPLYRHAQPAQVVPEKATVGEMPFLGTSEGAYVRGWNDCRAAMLQAQSDDDGEPTDDERIIAIEGIHNCERCGDEGLVVDEMGIMRFAWGQAGTLINEGTIQAGNSPVIPDGSASMLRRWLVFGRGMQNAGSQLPHNLIAETEEMLAAADCSIPMISDRWVPVSEKLPERGDYLVSDGRDFDVQLFNGEQFIPGFVW